MRGVDHVVEAASGQQQQQQALSGEQPGQAAGGAAPYGKSGEGAGSNVARLLSSPPVRLGFVVASAALGLTLLGQEEAGESFAARKQYCLPVKSGFVC